VSNEQVLHRGEEKLYLRKNIVKQKLAYAGHVMRASSDLNALPVLEGKLDGKKNRPNQVMERRCYTVAAEAKLREWLRTRTVGER